MKNLTRAALLALLLPAMASFAEEDHSYSFGALVGSQAKSLEKIDYDAFMKGFKASFEEKLSTEELQNASKTVQTYAIKLQNKRSEEAKTRGEQFLSDNGKRKGVKTTDSGLQYEIITAGKGDSPKSTDQVTVHYKGTFTNGDTFDSSYSRNEPATFPLGNVIPGWTEGVQLMKPGGKTKLYIPSGLAYGASGKGNIGPNETLIFEIELLEFKSPDSGNNEKAEDKKATSQSDAQ